jgi:hypothetical protein
VAAAELVRSSGVRLCVIAPWTPGLIWVRGADAGDVMVDGSVRGGRLRPLGLSWVAAWRREPVEMRELAASRGTIGKLAGLRAAITGVA